MDNNTEMLNEEIGRRIKELVDLEAGSEEESRAIENLNKLYKLRIEEIRTQNEDDERYARRAMDKDIQEQDAKVKSVEMKEHRIERFVRYGLDAAGIILPIAFYASWMRKGFEFEKEGTYTSTTFRGLFGKFRPTK